MAKTRNGGASVTAGAAGVRKQSKENVLGGHKVAKIKHATKASGPKKTIGPASKNKAVLAASVDNLTKKTGGLQLKSTGGSAAKDGVPKKVSKAAAPAKKSSGRAKAATLPKGEDPTTQVEELVSADFLPEGVSDIDSGDEETQNPQSAHEYVKSIYGYLREMEEKFAVPKDHLRNTHITARMRSILIDWLAQVSVQFKLLPETLYLTVDTVDRYLSHQGPELKYKRLQLVGVAAMMVACKYEEMYVPEVSDFVFITDSAYEPADILAKELDILKTLNFNLGKPIALNFLRRNSKAGYVGVRHHSLAKYILEESLPNYALASVRPSEKAAAALLISMKVLESSATLEELWCPNLAFYSGYGLSELTSAARQLANCILSATSPSHKYRAAIEKFNTNRHGHVAELAKQSKDILREFAETS